MALSWTLDKLGPLARTATDCALVLEAIAGPDAADRTTSSRRFRPLSARDASAAVRHARVGYDGAELERYASDAARGALERGAAEFLRICARTTVDATLPGEIPYGAMVTTVYAAEGATIFASLIEGDRFEELADARQKAGLRAALEIRARDYLQAMRLRTRVRAAFATLFERADVLLSAGRTITATPLDHPLDAPAPGVPRAPATASATPSGAVGNAALISAGNLAGLPAIFFPCGFGTDGLPVGLQLVGPAFSEALLVALVDRYQRETDHHRKRPRKIASRSA
jgi:aspartyl-tRNA(Asn)/glutamyl-tRNA(Gln) amidotransferase subunit A